MMLPHEEELMERLQDLLMLNDGWMGPDSLGPLLKVSETTGDLLSRLETIPENMAMAPLPDGGIRFEWRKDSADFVAEVEADGGLYLCILPENSRDDWDIQYEKVNAAAFISFVQDGELDRRT